MSRFCEVIVLARGAESVMHPLTMTDPDRDWHQVFRPVPDHWFAKLAPWDDDDALGRLAVSPRHECYMWVIQFARPTWRRLLSTLGEIAWPQPETVQVLIRDEEDDCFGLWMIIDGALTEVSLPRTERTEETHAVNGVLWRTDRQA